MNKLNAEELELLAAGYVLDDLDPAEMAQVEELLKSSSAMGEQIRQSMAVMGVLVTDVEPISPPVGLKNKIKQAFAEKEEALPNISQPENAPVKYPGKTIINLENWFQEIFEAGWQIATELLETPSVTPAFRNSGVTGGRLISINAETKPIILIMRVINTSTFNRDIVVEILPQLKQEYLPNGLKLMLLDSDGDTVMEATTRQENKNLKFDFTGTCGEAFSIKLELFNNSFQENFIL